MKRALILVSGVGASLYPILSCALGLGDLQVDSRLNQPLRAHIEISDVSEEEWRQIHARLAQQGEGVLLRTVLDSIVFRTTEDAGHRHFVEVTSNDPITEPLFDLSVAVAGQTVQVIRNYSVFLDPPGRDEVGSRGVSVAGTQGLVSPAAGTGASTPAAVAAGAASGADGHSGSSASASAADRVAAGSASRASTRRAARSAGRPAAGGSTRGVAGDAASSASAAAGAGANQQAALQAGAVYTVVQSDTLERIVRRLGARTAAAKSQQMQWVYEHNPGAFYGSIDRLRAGARLTLPEQGAAVAGAAGQSGAPVTTATPSRGAAVAAGATAQGGASAQGAAAVTTAAIAGSNVAAGAAGSDDRALQAQLESQVSTLQQTLAKMQETIAAQDAEIADLNRKIAARVEQQRAERATDALAAHIAPEVAAASDDGAQESGAAASRSIDTGAQESGSNAVRTYAGAAASDTAVAKRPPHWWAMRSTYYWAGALGGAAILVAVIGAVIRRRREAEVQYAPRYPLVEDSPFRYRATLETPPPPPADKPTARPPAPEVRKPNSGMQVEESESGLESWSTQTALLLSELPVADDTQPFMMAPHNDDETELSNKRRSPASSAEEPTARLQAMETTAELQTTGELMSPEELEEAELLGMEDARGPERDRPDEGRAGSSASGRGAAANAAELHPDGTAANKEMTELLEASLSYEPDRVDIKLKLLEIYCHEALGNRDNFRSLLSSLARDSRLLSPAQRQRVETLQRTLNEGTQDTDSTTVAEVAL